MSGRIFYCTAFAIAIILSTSGTASAQFFDIAPDTPPQVSVDLSVLDALETSPNTPVARKKLAPTELRYPGTSYNPKNKIRLTAPGKAHSQSNTAFDQQPASPAGFQLIMPDSVQATSPVRKVQPPKSAPRPDRKPRNLIKQVRAKAPVKSTPKPVAPAVKKVAAPEKTKTSPPVAKHTETAPVKSTPVKTTTTQPVEKETKVAAETPQEIESPAQADSNTDAAPVAEEKVTINDDKVTITFSPDQSTINTQAEEALEQLAKRTIDNPRIYLKLVSYASGDNNERKALRMSLSRALAARAFLLEKGVLAIKIEVQAKGNKPDNGNPERLDITIKER